MKSNSLKIIIFIMLILLLLAISFFSIYDITTPNISLEKIKKNRKLNEDLINELKINNSEAIYDKESNMYFYNISDKHENKYYIFKLKLKKGYKYKIINNESNIIKVNYDKPIKLIIFNDKYYYETKIQLTNLPIISIDTDSDITDEDINSTIKYIDIDNSVEVLKFNSKTHVRGASSKWLSKKSYRINIYNNSYTDEKNIQIKGFYFGHSFILDAIYRDPSKIRNVLSTNLWNDISNDFSNVDINSKFVELFVNNEYEGLYVFTEPINRRSLKLNKSSINDTSAILKTTSWNMFNSSSVISEYSNTNLGYEIKYPNNDELFPKVWDKFYNLLSNYYDNHIKNTDKVINNTFNKKNYVDMIIFNSFINNGDNHMIKNNYFYLKSLNDKTINIQPWDLEFTFGLNYHDKKLSTKDLASYNEIYTEFNLKYASKLNKEIIKRYWTLRKSILTKEYFDKLLDEYKEKLTKGASLRDSNKWYEYDIEEEIKEVRTWIYNRIDFFDEYVRGLEDE